MSKKLLVVIFLVAFLIPLKTSAENRSYYYDKIDVAITVNQDSTLSVEERQTYNYTGKYTVGWRSISLDKLGSVTNVEVFDGETGEKFNRVSKRPVTDTSLPTPNDYGKYTTFKKNGHQNIEWYYNMENTVHTWILRYKVHGTIEFGKDNDRLYYNIFTSYPVAVKNVQIKVILPPKTELDSNKIFGYRANTTINNIATKNNEITLSAIDFKPFEPLTVDFEFSNNLINKWDYFLDLAKGLYGMISLVILIIGTLITLFLRWYITERRPEKGQTIIPQYSPPQNLKPAEADVLINEHTTSKTWVSTLTDLAIRGYINIQEEKNKILFLKLKPEYILTLKKYFKDDSQLDQYEKYYLNALFPKGEIDCQFSTKSIKNQPERQKEINTDLTKARQALLEGVEKETDAYITGLTKSNSLAAILAVFLIPFIIIIFTFGDQIVGHINLLSQSAQPIILLSAILLSAGIIWIYFKYEARLSEKGIKLKTEWLGFKMYLEVAEKYRMQNLTPDLFEKYLPYAMIFSVEKKWAKNFEAMHLPPPNWYSSGMLVGRAFHKNTTANFSASLFSTSFSSSFASAFSSSTARSGGFGGGGSAGGGSGGGGGGAR